MLLSSLRTLELSASGHLSATKRLVRDVKTFVNIIDSQSPSCFPIVLFNTGNVQEVSSRDPEKDSKHKFCTRCGIL